MGISKKNKGLCIALASLAIMITAMTGCGSNQDTQGSQGSGNQVEGFAKQRKITLTVEIFAEDLDFWQKKSQEDAFKKALPNVTLDIQSVKDSDELLKT